MYPTMLSVGLDPALVAASPTSRAAFPDLDHDTIVAGAEAAYERLRGHGFTIERCLIDHGATAEAVYRAALTGRAFDYIDIGAGIRMDPALSHLFEMLVNVGAELNPRATLVFDTGPAAKAEAVLRWFPGPRPLPGAAPPSAARTGPDQA